MGDVELVRYEPALHLPHPTIRVLNYTVTVRDPPILFLSAFSDINHFKGIAVGHWWGSAGLFLFVPQSMSNRRITWQSNKLLSPFNYHSYVEMCVMIA